MNLLMSPLENSYVLANLLINSLLKCLFWSLLHFRQLNINNSPSSIDNIQDKTYNQCIYHYEAL